MRVHKMSDFIGMYESQASKSFHWFNIKMILAAFLSFQFPVSTTTFFLFGAETFTEFAMSSYISSTMICICVGLFLFVGKAEEMFKMFKNFENAIEKRENYILNSVKHYSFLYSMKISLVTGLQNGSSTTHFSNAIEQIEGISINLTKLLQATFLCQMTPSILLVVYIFFTKGLENNSKDYKLPYDVL